MLSRRIGIALACLVGLLLSRSAWGDPAKNASAEKPKKPSFIRLDRNKEGVLTAFSTAIVRFVPQDCGRTNPTVDLIAAVHVADKTYYTGLNREFEKYDAVLYELVAREGTQVPRDGVRRDSHPVSMIQRFMSDVLELQYQLEGVDYTVKNFVHADMSPEQVAKSMESRGESMWSMVLRMMGYAMARQANDTPGSTDARLLMALFDKNQAWALKRVMAQQFDDFQGSLDAIEGPKGSTLIAERNRVALGVLRKQIAAGKQKLAIFYGGAHMPDFETRLRDDFGLVRLSERWLTAWDLKEPGKPAKGDAASKSGGSAKVPATKK